MATKPPDGLRQALDDEDAVELPSEAMLLPAGALAGSAMAKNTGRSGADTARGAATGLGAGAGAMGGMMLARKLSDDPAAALAGLAGGGVFGFLAARRALRAMFPERDKRASVMGELQAAKRDSDTRNWPGKHARLRELMRTYPDDWYVDSEEGKFVGITHKTGFRFHMPRHAVPDVVLSRPSGVAPWQLTNDTAAATA